MSDELGQKYPCFGEFKCSRCNNKWQSSQTWAEYGQQCKHCAANVIPSNLQKLFLYICDNCKAKWKWNYVTDGLKCDRCKSSIFIRPLDLTNNQDREFIRSYHRQDLDKIDNDENFIDLTKEHRQDLCEKCRQLGRSCREKTGQELRQRTNRTSRSTTPYRAFLTVPEIITTDLPASYYGSTTIPSPSHRSSSPRPSPSMKRSKSAGKTILVLLGIVFLSLLYYWYTL